MPPDCTEEVQMQNCDVDKSLKYKFYMHLNVITGSFFYLKSNYL